MSRGYPTNYPYLRAWGDLMGSKPFYIRDQLIEAADEQAPQDAVYKCDHSLAGMKSPCGHGQTESHWVTINEIQRSDTRYNLEQRVFNMTHERRIPVE